MNKSNMKGNVGKFVRLFPPALGVGPSAPGNEDGGASDPLRDQSVEISHSGSGYVLSTFLRSDV